MRSLLLLRRAVVRFLVRIIDRLARSAQARGEYRRAERLFQRSIELAERALAPSDIEVATVLNDLGVLYKELSRFDEAERA
ncbi:MAG TPA: tetratricopeptide repeat protein, partial [Methylomirabilota bacterium]